MFDEITPIPKNKGGRKKTKRTRVPSLGLYRKIVISFIVVTALLIVVILYFSFLSATITVVPESEDAVTDFIVDVVEKTDGLAAGQVNGVFFSKDIEGEKDFKVTGSKALPTDAIGIVKIINNYRRPQPLVATTRLLSPEQILLRIKNRVDVPVGGSVEVEVYADDPQQLVDKTVKVGTHLIIPGLWPAVQDDIYAEVKTEIKLGERTVPVVAEDDIKKSTQKLLDQLELQSFIDLGLEGNVAKAVELQEENVIANAKIGDQVDQFNLKAKAKVNGVFFDKESLLRIAEAKLKSSLDANKELVSADYDSLTFSVENLDLVNKKASIKVHLAGQATLRLNSPIFDKKNLKGLTREQVISYFRRQAAVQSVTVDFFPFWLKTVPSFEDHIEVVIKSTN
ncbi:MAG: hypothetical protein WC480_01950 [Patescibacteria group bacterium]